MSEGNGKQDLFAAWQQEYTPKLVPVEVCFDGGLAARLAEAEQELTDNTEPKMRPPEELKAKVERFREEARAKTHTLVFKTVGRKRWRGVLSEHPPTPEQKRDRPMLDFNPETFPAPAMALSCAEPGLTLEQAQWLLDTLDVGDADRVWAACLDANITGVSLPKGIASPRAGAKKSMPQSS